MLCRLLLLAVVTFLVSPFASAEDLLAPRMDLGVADCTWKPFKIFTNGYVRPPGRASDEPLYLLKEPSDAVILKGTEPFDWPNAVCNVWPGFPLRIADEGKPEDRFAKIYYDSVVLWVRKTWSDGSPTLLPITPLTSEKDDDTKTR